jgi:hypothetical protein
MASKTGFVQSILEAVVAGRQRSADRYLENYLRDHRIAPRADKR